MEGLSSKPLNIFTMNIFTIFNTYTLALAISYI